ncbi:hypothetical protein J4443_05260 [Candidatus Woesearchaeota archaeon]|nr:hypothetical protein [Candidatus Woesearchaeota archaeon]
MDQKDKTMLLVVGVVVAVALVAINFDKITGSAVSNVDISVTPSVVAGGEVTVMVNANKNRVKNAIELRRVGGTEVRTCNFENCDGSWCSKPRFGEAGSTLVANCRTSPDWNGGYYALVKEYQSSKELGRAYFTVT